MASNSSCVTSEPTSQQLFDYYSSNSAAIVLIVFMSLFSVATVIMYLEACHYINKKVNDSRTRIRLTVIMGIYPVYSCTSLLALYVPRAHLITYLTATLYFSLALFQFLMLIMSYFGGRDQLLVKLKGTTIPIASPPLLCCCPCLPRPEMNAKNLLRLRRIVLQFVFIRPICNFIALILWADGSYVPGLFTIDSAYVWLTVIALCSTFIALYGVIILMRISKAPLEGYNVQSKFFLVQLVLVLITSQLVIVGCFVLTGLVPCEYPMAALTRGYYYCDLLTVAEMLIFIIFARFFFRKRIGRTPSGKDHPDHHFNSSKRDSESALNDIKHRYRHFDHPTSETSTKMNGNGVSYNNNNSGSYDNEGADAVEVHVEGGLTLKSFKVHEEDERRQEETEKDDAVHGDGR
ncbi:organic solute transporter subunit alpha [Strongylocentrotus purpuratus]|uniref:Organic solute transporter alpha-like protein n=1 Tax=Strongylocentrotus purpuratus TaxID=7668 RepID=A0A7M7PPA1_STRPU|nr:organic solute transporter subunit alpha [Strongylocentrotus purpuratus]